MKLMCIIVELETHIYIYKEVFVVLLQLSAVQPSVPSHIKASSSTGENSTGLWVVETEQWRCGDEGRRGEA